MTAGPGSVFGDWTEELAWYCEGGEGHCAGEVDVVKASLVMLFGNFTRAWHHLHHHGMLPDFEFTHTS